MMKGQNLIFEQVLLFGIAVAIFVMSYSIFQLYQGHYTYTSVGDQVKGVRDLLVTHVVQMAKLPDANMSVTVPLPKKISGELYIIEFAEGSLNITTVNTITTAGSTMYGLGEDFDFSGKTTSSKGEIIIYKRGSNIILE